MVSQLEKELIEHRKNPPEKGAKSRLIQDYCKKESFLKFEVIVMPVNWYSGIPLYITVI